MNISSEKKAESVYHKKDIYQREPVSNLKDFLLPIVEFFGILVPGIFFLTALIPSVIVPFVVLFKTTTLYINSITGGSHDQVLKVIDFHWILINKTFVLAEGGFNKTYGLLFLIFSYIIGHILFRQDIKVADFASFNKTSKRYKEVGPVRRRKRDNEKSYKEAEKFPYRDLGVYLKRRGLKHLEKRIPWRGKDISHDDQRNYRTRHFINNLKIHIEFVFPRQYIKIQKNEAHVRLMASMWYVLTWVMVLSLSVFFSGSFVLLLSIFNTFALEIKTTELILLPYFLFPPFSVLIISYLSEERNRKLFTPSKST